ncbi:LRR domain containing protein [Parasponia andersonii]|uniref:LRR domain containing protein n=1 Tax=Parasponia andersonii TaxID=3476 RepID=A0A2P5E5B1_PARAD|nr:LRR domain containing protein [Parasponia andersonii]
MGIIVIVAHGDGVQCDRDTGHVIALDLTSSWLSGAFDSNSSLFEHSQLRSLSLADNDFNDSQIPSRLSHLSRVVHLNLSFSVFKGQIPSEFSQLSRLVSLDLSDAYLNSTVPRFLTNLSSLVTLCLRHCHLYGQFPKFVFQFPNLQHLDLAWNMNLSGSLPEFHFGSSIQKLFLYTTGFSGIIPSSIGNLNSLKALVLSNNTFRGLLPSSLGRLTGLTILDLSYNNFTGSFPSFLQNLTLLAGLFLSDNEFSGQIPVWLGNLTQLTELRLGHNKLHGPVPRSFSRLVNLEGLQIGYNELNGTLEFGMFLDLKHLSKLQLSGNKLSVLTETDNANATLSKFEILQLRSCNLSIFPNFLRYQQKLEMIDISGNQIYGQIPKWVLNTSTESLLELDFSSNSLTGFDQGPPVILPWVRLASLDLSRNMLKGSVPIPPPSVVLYYLSDNELNGEISSLFFCNISLPRILNLANNLLTGTIPKCFEKQSSSFSLLILANNYFHGTIPRFGTNGSELVAVDLSYNQFEGPLPRSLANCTKLELLNLGNNKLDDGFPSWLGTLPELRILLLRQNHLHGIIEEPISKFDFPKLHVIDLSHNSFSGLLPSHYFKQWNAMARANVGNSSYLRGDSVLFSRVDRALMVSYLYSMSLANRGMDLAYDQIQEVFVAIDFSGNRFEGDIPDCIGILQGIQVLNISNNILTGGIPISMGNMTRLESLDLSENRLTGEIPPQLVQLTFLAFFNVSHNNLTGLIPRGKQFNTFENTSFIGNLGLCGDPLSKKCGNSESPAPTSLSSQEQDSGSLFDFNWMTVLFGYLGGLVVGIAIENIVEAEYGLSGMMAFWLWKLKLRGWRRRRA